MEWLRSCYESKWHLFKSDLAQVTGGEYYFSPPGTPFYAGWHRVGSRNWQTTNWDHVQTLGEDLETKQQWDDGDVPAPVIRNSVVGNADCIENGEDILNGIPTNQLEDGFVPGCIFPRDEAARLWDIVSDYENCCTQRAYAILLQALYIQDIDAATIVIREWLGELPIIRMHIHQGPRCGLLTIKTDAWIVGILDGTQNDNEFALQAFSFIVGPTNFNLFSTVPLWWSTSTYINNLLNDDGQTADGKLMLVGHSYGAGVALTSVARYRAWSSSREISYLTFGCPKIGDQRFIDLLRACDGLNIANDDDIVPVLPPDKITLAPVVGLFPAVPLFLYTEWLRPYPQTLLRVNGEMDYQTYTLLDTGTLLRLLNRVITHRNIDVAETHLMPEYIARLQTRCGVDDAACKEPLDFILTYPVEAISFRGPRRPRGALVFNGGGIENTGNTCAEAIVFKIGENVYPQQLTSATRWYRCDIPSATLMHITVKCSGPCFFAGNLFRGSACVGLTGVHAWFIVATQCFQTTTFADASWYLRLGTIQGVISFRVDLGPC